MSKITNTLPIVILASGTGTNARVLMEYAKEYPEHLKVVAVISDRPEVGVLAIAKEFGVATYIVDHRSESTLLALMQKLKPSWACLAGYKRKVGQGFLDHFWDASLGFSRIMNIHPSLLPAFPGLNGYKSAFEAGVKVAGVTVHLVDAGLDTGKTILQECFERDDDDTLETFEKKGRKIEHKIYVNAVKLAAAGRVRLVTKNGATFVSTEK